jgi:hypothetical protein
MKPNDDNDDAIKRMLANSKLEIGNGMFTQVLMEKIMLAERRRISHQRRLSWAILLSGGFVFFIAISLYLNYHGAAPLFTFYSNLASLIHPVLQGGKWVLSYLRITEVILVLFILKVIVEWQMEVA